MSVLYNCFSLSKLMSNVKSFNAYRWNVAPLGQFVYQAEDSSSLHDWAGFSRGEKGVIFILVFLSIFIEIIFKVQ